MADPIRRKSAFRAPVVDETQMQGPTGEQRVAGEAVRSVAERGRPILAMLTRLASGVAASPGGVWGAGISGAGEALAQQLEGADHFNKGRIAVEAGIGALPFSMFFKAGKPLVSAARGALMGAGSTVARKGADVITGEDPDALKKWSKWDALAPVIGGVTSGVIGNFSKDVPNVAPAPTMAPHGPETVEDFLRSKKRWSPEQIQTEASKMESQGYPDAAHGLRIASRETNTGNAKIYDDITARNTANATLGPLPPLDQALAHGPKAVEAYALRAEAAGDHDYARKLREMAVAQGASSDVTSRATIRVNKAEEKASQKATDEANAKTELETMKEGLEAQPPTVRESVSVNEGGVRTSGTRTFRQPKPPEEGEELGGGAKPKTPKGPKASAGPTVAPKEGVFQIVDPKGRVISELTDENDVAELLNTAGPQNQFRVVEPAKPKIVIESEQPLKVSTEPTPETSATPATAPTGEPTTPVQPTEPVSAAPAPTVAPSGPQTSGEPLAAPLAFKVAEQQLTPEGGAVGSPFARFFRNRGQAQKAQDYSTRLTNEQIDTFQPILAQYEAAAKKSPGARHFGELLGRMRDDMGLPRNPNQMKVLSPEVPPTPVMPGQLEQELASRIAPSVAEAAPEVTPMSPSRPPSGSAPPAILAKAEEFHARKEQLLNAAKSPEEAQAIAASLEKEANDIQLELSLAERAVEKQGRSGGEAGFASPELLGHLAGAGVGAAVGASMDPNDRAGAAMLGGVAGALAPTALKGLSRIGNVATEAGAKGLSPMERAVNYQRFALLSHPGGLAINTIAPTGGAMLGALEQSATGAVERSPLLRQLASRLGYDLGPETDAAELGREGLKALMDPNRVRTFNSEDIPEAGRLLKTSEERADMSLGGGTPTAIDQLMAVPAGVMTAGDISARKALERGGWSEDLSRKVTATSNPRYSWLGEPIVNLSRKSPMWRFLLPFSRTAANVVEGSLERLPILGFAMHMAQTNPALQESLAQQIAEQGIGGAVGLGSYLLGRNTNPDDARQWKALSIVTNLSGQYGAIAGAAFTAGQAAYNGDSAGQQAGRGAQSFYRDLPMPTVEVADEMKDTLVNATQGEFALPDNLTPRLYTFAKEHLAPETRQSAFKPR